MWFESGWAEGIALGLPPLPEGRGEGSYFLFSGCFHFPFWAVKADGLWTSWDDFGNKVSETTYKNGVKVKVELK